MDKIGKHEYYMGIAKSVAVKSTCRCVAIGSLIVKNDQIISTGFVGAPRKTKDCIDLGFCIRRKNNIPSGHGYEVCRSLHGEMNGLINAARAGVSLLEGTMYLYAAKREGSELVPVKAYPCLMCKKMIINAGLQQVVCGNADGSLSFHEVSIWVKDWQDLDDLSMDTERYGIDYDHSK